MSSGTKRKFISRYDEGYDLEDDEFYIMWVKLKQLSLQDDPDPKKGDKEGDTVVAKESAEQDCHSSIFALLMTTSSVFDEILTYPKPDKQKKKKRWTNSPPKPFIKYTNDSLHARKSRIEEEEDKHTQERTGS